MSDWTLRLHQFVPRAIGPIASALLVAAVPSCTQRNPAFQVTVVHDAEVPPMPGAGGDSGKHEDPPLSTDPRIADPGPSDAAVVDLGAKGETTAPAAPDTEPPAPDAGGSDTACGAPSPAGWSCIPAGNFTMGSPSDEKERESQEVLHQVTVTRPFWMGATEVTRREWRALMPKDPSNHTACGLDCPVEMMTWYDSVAYANAASLRDGLPTCYFTDSGAAYDAAAATGKKIVRWPRGLACNGYRLPTESEWEYAARAGATTAFPGGTLVGKECTPVLAVLDVVGWYCGNADSTTHPVGVRAANAWGLFDMHGNVWEWVWDTGASYPSGAVTDPIGPDTGDERISRGGSYHNPPNNCRAAVRSFDGPAEVFKDTGLRLVRTAF